MHRRLFIYLIHQEEDEQNIIGGNVSVKTESTTPLTLVYSWQTTEVKVKNKNHRSFPCDLWPSGAGSCWKCWSHTSSDSLLSAAGCTVRSTPVRPVWSSLNDPPQESAATCCWCISLHHLQVEPGHGGMKTIGFVKVEHFKADVVMMDLLCSVSTDSSWAAGPAHRERCECTAYDWWHWYCKKKKKKNQYNNTINTE